TVRQAASHEQTVRAQNRIPEYLPSSTVIVSLRRTIDSLAVPHAGNLFYLSHEDVVRLFDTAVQAFSHVRATAGNSSQEVLRDNFVKAYQERGLWLPDIKAILQRVRLSSLPVK